MTTPGRYVTVHSRATMPRERDAVIDADGHRGRVEAVSGLLCRVVPPEGGYGQWMQSWDLRREEQGE